MIDALANGTRRGTRGKKKGTCVFPMRYRDGRTDLHQDNHGYTSYGRSLYTRAYRFIDASLSLSLSLSVFRFTLRGGTFLVGGREQKSRMVN